MTYHISDSDKGKFKLVNGTVSKNMTLDEVLLRVREIPRASFLQMTNEFAEKAFKQGTPQFRIYDAYCSRTYSPSNPTKA